MPVPSDDQVTESKSDVRRRRRNERKANFRRKVVRVMTLTSSIPVLRPIGIYGMRKTFNALAENWEKIRGDFVYREAFDSAFEAIPTHFPDATAPSNALDLGCGTGIASGLLRERFPDLPITGIDIAEDMIRLARDQVPTAQFDVGSTLDLPYEDALFDLLVSLDGFFSCAEIARVAAPGAVVVIVYSRGESIPIRVEPKAIVDEFKSFGFETAMLRSDSWVVWAYRA